MWSSNFGLVSPLQHRNATMPAAFESEGSRTSCSPQDLRSVKEQMPLMRECSGMSPDRVGSGMRGRAEDPPAAAAQAV
jgi:hypothetical protein